MRVFVTGATGTIGGAIVRALVKAGHHVGGLHRRMDQESRVRQTGAVPIFGHLKDPETFQHFAAECDAVVHAAFESPEIDRFVVEEIIGALHAEGEQKAFIYTSGVWTLGSTGSTVADERASTDAPVPRSEWRPAVERAVLDGANDDLATAVIRPGMLYGGPSGGCLKHFLETASSGSAAYVDAGANHWSMVQPEDLAELYRLVVEKRARGVFHGVDGAHPTTLELARGCSDALGKSGAVRSVPSAQARQEWGVNAEILALDQCVVAPRSRELGWTPARKSCLESIPAAIREWKH